MIIYKLGCKIKSFENISYFYNNNNKMKTNIFNYKKQQANIDNYNYKT
jgi:hypothetical protein